jgi:hypothetical protein
MGSERLIMPPVASGFFLGLFFDAKDGDDISLQDVELPQNYTGVQHRRSKHATLLLFPYMLFIPHCIREQTLNVIVGLTAVTTKSAIVWHVTPSSKVDGHRRFGGIYYLHLQARRMKRAYFLSLA